MRRRAFILGALAAPALVRPGLIMPVRPIDPVDVTLLPAPSVEMADLAEVMARWDRELIRAFKASNPLLEGMRVDR